MRHCMRLGVAVALVLAAALAACGDDEDGAASGGGPEKATIAIPIPTAAYALPQFAVEEGLFRKHGVDAEVKVIPPPGVLNLMVSGRMNYGMFSGPVTATTQAQGSDLVWASTYISKPLVSFMARPDIKSVADLEGKAIAITTAGSLTSQLTEWVLSENGLSKDDVTLRPVGGQEQARNALLTGQVQAAMLASPDDLLVEKQGMRQLVDLREEDVSFPFGGIITKRSFAQQNAELTKNVLAALEDAVASWKAKPEAAKRVIGQMTKADTAFVEQSYADVTKHLNDRTSPDRAAVDFEVELLAASDPEASKLKPDDLILQEPQ